MAKKIFRLLICILGLVAAILFVFWFNQSPASKKTVTEEDLLPPVDAVIPEDDRPAVTPDKENSNIGTNPDTDTTPDGSANTDNPDISEKPDPDKEAFDRFMASRMNTQSAGAEGYTQNVYTYTPEGKPVLVAVKLSEYTNSLTPDETQQYRITYRYDKESGQFIGVYRASSVPMLTLYGGLLLATQDRGMEILSWIGEYADSAMGYYPIYQKDAENRAIFEKNGSYYYYDEENGQFVPTEKPDYYGVYFDGAPGSMYTDADLTPFHDPETMKWGYRDRSGEIVIKAQYYRAYSFSENGIAAVQKNKQDGLLFIDTTGKVVLDSHLKYYKYEGATAFNWFRAPETLDESAIGCLTFDHGYMRVTLQTYALINSTEALVTKQALVDADGNQLHLPEDYRLVSYSDGVAVLEKDGRYGYYSYLGKWLNDPLYQYAHAYVGGLGVAIDQNGRYHVFDTEGNEIIPGVFDYVSSVSMGQLLCYRKNEGWMLLTMYQKPKTEDSDNTEDTSTEDIQKDETVS